MQLLAKFKTILYMGLTPCRTKLKRDKIKRNVVAWITILLKKESNFGRKPEDDSQLFSE